MPVLDLTDPAQLWTLTDALGTLNYLPFLINNMNVKFTVSFAKGNWSYIILNKQKTTEALGMQL